MDTNEVTPVRSRSILGRIRRASSMLVREPKMLFFYLHRHVGEPRLREIVADLAALGVRSVAGRAAGEASPATLANAAELARSGIVNLPDQVTRAEIDEIVGWLREREGSDPYTEGLGRFSVDARPAQARLLHYSVETVLACPHLVEIANRPGNLLLAQEHLGAKPTIYDMSVWWSFPADEGKEAQLFHRDIDDLRFCKLFVYLSDVDEESGPHVYVPTSHRSSKSLEARRHTDEEVERAFGREAPRAMCGPAGTSFMANTFGFHKGLVPKSRPRLLLQIAYSLFPVLAYDYSFRAPVDPGFPYDRYVNRLFFGAGGGASA